MAAAVARLESEERRSAWRFAVTLLVLAVFALQSYVTQTHFHANSLERAQINIGAAAQPAAPADHEVVGCPLCQAIASAGAFLTSSPPAASRPAERLVITALPAAETSLAATSAGHAWRSRAPPRS